MTVEVVGRRERKKQETRLALSTAALQLAVERGPDQITVEDVADAADVSARTFFNYFSSKEAAILGVDPDRAEELAAALRARPADEPPLAALRAVLVASGDAFVDQAAAWALRTRLLRDHPALMPGYLARFAPIERALIEAVADRIDVEADRHVYPSLVVGAAVTAMRAALRCWQAPGSDADLPALIDEAFDELAAGLTPPHRPRRRRTP